MLLFCGVNIPLDVLPGWMSTVGRCLTLTHGIGGSLGVIILLAVLAGLSGVIYWRSRATKVDHSNVNDEWSGGVAPAEPEPAAAA